MFEEATTATTWTRSSSTTEDCYAPPDSSYQHQNQQPATLYDILGAKGHETRAELKQLYIALAKKHHPDAIRNSRSDKNYDGDDDVAPSSTVVVANFSEIASAWKVLSDPKTRKRYDRNLQAERLSENIAHWADEFLGKKAGPVLEKVATQGIPFLRRTTATTLAGIHAVTKDLQNHSKHKHAETHAVSTGLEVTQDTEVDNTVFDVMISDSDVTVDESISKSKPKESDFSRTFHVAMEAASRANRYVDSMELQEKSQALEQQADLGNIESDKLQRAIESISQQRITIALHTPKSGLTATEAYLVLQEFNKTVRDSVSMIDRTLLMKHTIEEDILALQKAEISFSEVQSTNEQIHQDYEQHKQRKIAVHEELVQAIQAEEDAIRALELAQKRLIATKIELSEVIHDIQKTRAVANRSTNEVKKASNNLLRQSERVRKALRSKEQAVLKSKGLSPDTDALPDATTEEQRVQRLEVLKKMRQEEIELITSRHELDDHIAELLQQAIQLKEKAKQLEEQEEKA